MPKFAANLSMMFNEWDFLDRFAAAADNGFTAVEFLFPYAHAPDEIARRLQASGLTQALFNLPPGDWAAGERGLGCDPGRIGEFQGRISGLQGVEHFLLCVRLRDADCGRAPKILAGDACLSRCQRNAVRQPDADRHLNDELALGARFGLAQRHDRPVGNGRSAYQTPLGQTAVLAATAGNHLEVVKLLIARGAWLHHIGGGHYKEAGRDEAGQRAVGALGKAR